MLSTPHHHRAPQLAIWLMADSMEIFEYTDILFMANLDQGPKLLKAEGCAKACSARPNCAGFSLTMDENCWLKKGGGRPRLARNFAVTSALKRRNGILQSFDAPAVDVCGAPLAEKLLPTFTKEGAPLNQDDPNQSSNGDKKMKKMVIGIMTAYRKYDNFMPRARQIRDESSEHATAMVHQSSLIDSCT